VNGAVKKTHEVTSKRTLELELAAPEIKGSSTGRIEGDGYTRSFLFKDQSGAGNWAGAGR
jgi:hypothetical protein